MRWPTRRPSGRDWPVMPALRPTAHQRAATRYLRAWELGLEEYGNIGVDPCPRMKDHEEFGYFLTLVAGLMSVVHDSQSGRTLEIPQETVLAVSRGAECLMSDADNDGTVDGQEVVVRTRIDAGGRLGADPGSGPEGSDPWAIMEEMSTKADLWAFASRGACRSPSP